ncbi:MAG: SEC-C metal-binding domain-containing protein, partial [Gammaproteobacteria bacterium]|nr:SEC-C metal-binding domain-containing protein [Gammaproteobacteria bacterium]
ARLAQEFALDLEIQKWLDEDSELHEESLRERIAEEMVAQYREKEQQVGVDVARHFEKAVMLQVLDSLWKEHLASMDYLRQGIHLRGYAQKNPKQEYKRESFELFTDLLDRIKRDVIGIISRAQVNDEEDVAAVEAQRRNQGDVEYQHAEASAIASSESNSESAEPGQQPFVRDGKKVGRNEPCPCGSGKKYKQCHGKLQ